MKDRKTGGLFPTALLLLLLAVFTLGGSAASGEAAGEQAAAQDEWTVMFYMCGSDLESRYGYATGNLEEITTCSLPDSMREMIIEQIYHEDPGEKTVYPGVNLVVETGGCQEWHAERLNMEISTTSLQRWEFKARPGLQKAMNPDEDAFVLVDERPLASMADPGTLADFIRWSAEKYPARKYALILWDHGGGSKRGLFIDELFNGDILRLPELEQALRDSGVHLETILFDACMMANVETAYCVRNYANWMVASEEVVAGQGTAIGSWLQQLYRDPQEDGRCLGTWICDMTQIKYSANYNESSGATLTWSLIDLSKIERVGQALDKVFAAACNIYEKYPVLLSFCLNAIYRTEEYGSGEDNMFDLQGIFYDQGVAGVMDDALRREMLDALRDAVVYSVRGTGRSAARGLSFCFATDFTNAELDTYAANCPSPNYVALLDAVSCTWDAPPEIYEKGLARKLKCISDIEDYTVRVRKRWNENRIPALELISGGSNYHMMLYRLYRYNPDLDETVCLGQFQAQMGTDKDGTQVLGALTPWLWPSIDGVVCNMVMIQQTNSSSLCEIPIQIGTENWKLRCGYNTNSSFEVYGIWDRYNVDSTQFNRNVKSLLQVAGQEYRLLYPIYTNKDLDTTYYETSKMLTMPRVMDVKEIPLEEGTYYLEYVVEDIFMRQIAMEQIEMKWENGELSFPRAEEWTGEAGLKWLGWPRDLKQ